jgi:NhaA family Na+:H+ antiporter
LPAVTGADAAICLFNFAPMTTADAPSARLDRPVDPGRDHVLGPPNAPITLVEYGSYACPHCRAANERITEVRAQLGDRVRYVFRQRPLSNNELAWRAAALAEMAAEAGRFWDAHVMLMTRSRTLSEEDLAAVATELGLVSPDQNEAEAAAVHAEDRVKSDLESANASGVRFTPTFYINGNRYDGPWDESSFTDAMLGTLGHRVRTAALRFASWAPSTGLLLLGATVLAVLLANSPLGEAVDHFWHTPVGLSFGSAEFRMSLQHWVNDGLLSIFFFVVGLEIKREFTVGSLASRRSAALPVAAAIGGMAVPALLYALVIPGGPWARGWGVPMATDTAFAVALIVMMGSRVPVELRVFLTAAAIVDDLGAISVVAVAYSGALRPEFLLAAGGLSVLLWLFNRLSVYRVTPYLVVGVALWAAVYVGGLHATLSGVILAMFIPTRPPPDYKTLGIQADTLLAAEVTHASEHYRSGPSVEALQALDAIHDRIEAPADRMLRTIAPRASYLVLPVFALANAGVALDGGVFSGRGALMAAIAAGLVIGKPVGFVLASALAVRLGVAAKPDVYSWRQVVGVGALAGIGFTMSLFIAGQAFEVPGDFAAAKIAVFAASVISAAIGVAVLWSAPSSRSSVQA